MNVKPFTRFAFSFLRVLLTAVLLLGLGPVVQPVARDGAALAAPLAALVTDFYATPTSGVAFLTVDFTNTSSGSYTSSLWDFGDGGTSKKESPSHRYKTPGVYTVSLTVDGPDGMSTIAKPDYITVCDSAYADFEAAPVSGAAPLSVAFSDRSCGAFSSWSWDFGDGSPAGSDANPTHTYSADGVYTVTLTASGADGTATQTKTGLITVYDPVQADFSAQPTSGVAPLSVAFTDASSGDYSSSEWDFGDGATSSEASPTHVYEAPGVYTVALTASGPGGTDTETKADYVTVYTPVEASFSAVPTSGPAPLSVAFTDASSGDYSSSEWDFSDGTTSADTDPAHVFTTPGVYTVTLTVSGLGGSDTAISPGCITVYTPVQAAFSATPTTGIAPLAASFSDASTGDYDTLAWDFGDGSPVSSEANPTHTYAAGGVYTVSLTASGPGGTSVETKADYVTVYTPVQAGFSATPTTGIAPLSVAFTDLSTGDYTALSWDFGDDSPVSAEPNPAHTYTAGGTYTVTLTAEGPGGTDTMTETDYITVYTPAAAAFEAAPTSGLAPLTVTFTNTSTGDYAESLWDFGDTITSTLASPVHTYTAAGTYTPTLTISGPGGSDVATGSIEVSPSVQASFTAEPISGTVPLTVTFTNTSTGTYTTSEWDFGDTVTSTLESPVHTFTAVGVYTVTLTVSGAEASDTATGQVGVYEPALAGFSAEPQSGVVPLAVTFTNASTGDFSDSLWDFGDTVTSTLESPVHLYNAPGLYTVSLTVSGLGNSDTKVVTDCIAVYPVIPEPGPWQTSVVLQNLGAGEASARLLLSGASLPYDIPRLPPRAAWAIPATTLMPGVAEAWTGSGVLRSSEPLAAVAPMTWDYALGPRTAAVYAAQGAPATTAYLPWLTAGEGHLSQIVVQNTSDVEASVSLHLYDLAGGVQSIQGATVAAHDAATFSVAGLEPDFSATGGRGVAVITADQPVAVVGVVHTHESSEAYAAWTAGAATLLAPGAVRRVPAEGEADWSELAVQNPGEAAASVHVEFIAADGTLSHALDGSIPAHGGATYSTEGLAELGDDWQGTVRATSTGGQPLTAVSVGWAPSTGAVDNLAWNAVSAAAAGPLAFPAVYRRLAGADDDQWSAVLVHNAAAAAGSVDVEFYDATGKVGETYSVAVPAQGLARLSLKDGLDLPQAALDALGTAFAGSMWVTPSAGMEIAGVAETVWPEEGRAAGYVGMAAP